MILRVSLAITLAVLSVSSDTVSTPLSVTSAILGCLIGSGFLTRGAATVSLALIAASTRDDPIALLPIVAEAVSLMLVGAGAYSLDEVIFHKRLSEWSNRA